MSTKKRNGKPQGSTRLAPVSGYAPVLVMPLNTAPETVAEARGHGYLPVLADDPNKVLVAFPAIGDRLHGDMLMAALHGLSCIGFGDVNKVKVVFVEELLRRLLKREGA